MSQTLSEAALDQLFRKARTQNAWQASPVDAASLRLIYDLARMGPTSANCSPGRFLFVASPEAKERLRPALSSGNLDKTMTAPVTVIAAYDRRFFDHLPVLFPHADAKTWFTSSADLAEETAFRNATLQAAYLMLAARAVGLDVGPMSGFDRQKVDAAFFASTQWRSNFLINIGKGEASKVLGRLPRLAFEEACEIL